MRSSGTGYAGMSLINWVRPNQNVATTMLSSLGGDRSVTMHGGAASTHFVVGVTGYYR